MQGRICNLLYPQEGQPLFKAPGYAQGALLSGRLSPQAFAGKWWLRDRRSWKEGEQPAQLAVDPPTRDDQLNHRRRQPHKAPRIGEGGDIKRVESAPSHCHTDTISAILSNRIPHIDLSNTTVNPFTDWSVAKPLAKSTATPARAKVGSVDISGSSPTAAHCPQSSARNYCPQHTVHSLPSTISSPEAALPFQSGLAR